MTNSKNALVDLINERIDRYPTGVFNFEDYDHQTEWAEELADAVLHGAADYSVEHRKRRRHWRQEEEE